MDSSIFFSERYDALRSACGMARETGRKPGRGSGQMSEHTLQCVWYDHLFSAEDLRTREGHTLRILSPGWWNHQEGPDFKGAQIEFNGKLVTGDVEVHLEPGAWSAHQHHLDSRYDDVVLHVVLRGTSARASTSEGRELPTLVLESRLSAGLDELPERLSADEYPEMPGSACGRCMELEDPEARSALMDLLRLAGEWRMLNKARALRERMEQAGPDQAVHESFLYACGFGHFKHHFRAIARSLPYERARQLALQDPLLLETALLQIAGLLPDSLPEGTTAVPHFARLRALRRDHLGGLRSLPLTWRRTGIRPANQPERRLAGAARFLARTAREGLTATLDSLWQDDVTPLQRRRAFEALFPGPTGFWAQHCTWAGKKMDAPSQTLGAGRIRSIIGNVFIPAALALARRQRDRMREERIHLLFQSLPKEPTNRILELMTPRLLAGTDTPRVDFQLQQGLLQIHQDWCEGNPSCHNCTLLGFLKRNDIRK